MINILYQEFLMKISVPSAKIERKDWSDFIEWPLLV
jgi:hypothetical protein